MPTSAGCGTDFLSDHGEYCRNCGMARVAKIQGSVTLTDSSTGGFDPVDGVGTGDFADIRSGTRVTVRDEDGRVIGTGALGDGHVVRSADDRGSLNRRCIFLFVVKDLPDSEIYNVTVGHHAAGDHSTQEVRRSGGVHLTFGS